MLAAFFLCALAACERDLPEAHTLIGPSGVRPIAASDEPPWQGHALPTPLQWDRRLALMGLMSDVDSQRVQITVWLLVTGELAGRLKPELVLAFQGRGASGARQSLPLSAALTPLEWRPGDVVVVSGVVTVPEKAAPGPVELFIADAGPRWPAAARSPGGGRAHADRVIVGELKPAAAAIADDDAHATRTRQPVRIDGLLDDEVWARALPRTLKPYRNGSPVSAATSVRFAYDDDAVYVAFDVDDDDPFSPYDTRDDPLYEGEALELFIDADGDGVEYVELQANIKDVHFDAAFAGGPRRGMRVQYDLPFETKTTMRAGGYVMEWRVPMAGIADLPLPTSAPASATTSASTTSPSTTLGAATTAARAPWRIQAFRLERRRDAGGAVVATEASSLWPIERNDFHALDRMGLLRFDP